MSRSERASFRCGSICFFLVLKKMESKRGRERLWEGEGEKGNGVVRSSFSPYTVALSPPSPPGFWELFQAPKSSPRDDIIELNSSSLGLYLHSYS